MSEGREIGSRRPARGWETIGVVCTLLTLAAASLGLTAIHFQAEIESDMVYPHMVVLDVLDQTRPLAGWTFSSAPCFVPDLSLLTALTAALGRSGVTFAAYPVLYFVLLALAAGMFLKAAGWKQGGAHWAGALATLSLVLSGYSLGHYKFLSWCCLPVSHGGSLLLGLVFTAGVFGAGERISSRRLVFLTFLVLAATASDSLFLVQFALPVLATLWWHRKERGVPDGKTALVLLAVGLGGWLLLRVLLAGLGWFHISKVFRYAPWPSAIWESTTAWWHDFTGGIVSQAPIFVAVAAAAFAVLLHRRTRLKQQFTPRETWMVLCLAATWAMPLVTCYWKNYQHGRYLLPFIVVPGLWLLARAGALVGSRVRTVSLVVLTVSLSVVTVACLPKPLTASQFTWPKNSEDDALQAFLESRNLHDGFADYWNCHRFNLYRRGQTHLHALKTDGRVLFWNNNAYSYCAPETPSGQWEPLKFQFIVTERLEESALVEKFGEPDERVSVGDREVWLYANGQRLTEAVKTELKKRLE